MPGEVPLLVCALTAKRKPKGPFSAQRGGNYETKEPERVYHRRAGDRHRGHRDSRGSADTDVFQPDREGKPLQRSAGRAHPEYDSGVRRRDGDAIENMQDAVDILTTEGYNFKSMKPRSQGHAFVWERTKNQILLLNDEGTVIYPENADTTDVQMFVSDFNDLPAIVHTAVLNTNIIVTEEIDLTGKTVDINNYVLDISGAGKLLVAGVRNGYLTDTAMASLGDLADAGSTRQIAAFGRQ